jgi:hypothetical protein
MRVSCVCRGSLGGPEPTPTVQLSAHSCSVGRSARASVLWLRLRCDVSPITSLFSNATAGYVRRARAVTVRRFARDVARRPNTVETPDGHARYPERAS